MDAFFFIDKPTGMTSFDVLRQMKRSLQEKKIGHTGTLDPLATGGLLVATGNYTKLIPYVEKDSKSYRAHIMLDGTSPSFDCDTEITYLSETQQKAYKNNVTQEKLESILKENFYGKISQIPPKYSALKIDGKRALDRTLAGEDIEMKVREAEIISYEIIYFTYPELVVDFTVAAGTYIRSIAHDLGEILETGGYLSALRRTAVGKLDIALSTQLENCSWDDVLKVNDIFADNIVEFYDEVIYKRLSDGQRVRAEVDLPVGKDVFLTHENQLRFIVEYKHGVIHPRKKII